MDYSKVPNTDLKISVITLGTWVLGGEMWGGAQEAESIAAVQTALDNGITAIDTAPIYGYGIAESVIGKAMKGRDRSRITLATKCGLVGKGRSITNNLKPESIRQEVEDSLRRLQTDYIDLYQCHWPDPNTPIAATMQTLKELKAQGKIRYIGVSNFEANLLADALKEAPVVTLQSQFSMLDRALGKKILPFCRSRSVGVLAYGPMAGGILSGKYNDPPKFKGGDARSFFYKYYSGPMFAKVKKLLTGLPEFQRPLNQIAINWVRQQEGVASVLVGCRNPGQVLDNIKAAEWKLSEPELERINSLLAPIGND